MNNDERMLLSALRSISRGDPPRDVDLEYSKALVTLGFATDGWDWKITELGRKMLAHLEPDTWGS